MKFAAVALIASACTAMVASKRAQGNIFEDIANFFSINKKEANIIESEGITVVKKKKPSPSGGKNTCLPPEDNETWAGQALGSCKSEADCQKEKLRCQKTGDTCCYYLKKAKTGFRRY